jgi:hypothetical protein
MECNSVCSGIKQFLAIVLSEAAFWAAVVVAVMVGVSATVAVIRDALSKTATERINRFATQIEELHRAITNEYPSPPLTLECLPQEFPSKQAAQAFGDRWSRGKKDCYWAKSVDASGNDEDHPRFDRSSIVGGRLYTHPAVFFGMASAHGDSDAWWIEFQRLRKQWLENYLNQLRKGVTPY